MRELSCAACAEMCIEVALGIAEAESRAEVLSHVEHCATCRTQLRSLTEVADGLAALVPPSPPPPGFDERVLDAISRTTAPSPAPTLLARVRARPLAVAAAVIAAAAIGFGGWALGKTESTPSPTVVTAALLAKDAPVGEIIVTPGDPPWISVVVHLDVGKAVVRCEVRSGDGALTTVGRFTLIHGDAYWSSSLPYGMVVRGAELVTPSGHVLASATLG